jgi:hypothetical protein
VPSRWIEKAGGLWIIGSGSTDRMAEIHVEICLGSARKSEVESHGNIPWDTHRMLNGSGFLDESTRGVLGSISVLI